LGRDRSLMAGDAADSFCLQVILRLRCSEKPAEAFGGNACSRAPANNACPPELMARLAERPGPPETQTAQREVKRLEANIVTHEFMGESA